MRAGTSLREQRNNDAALDDDAGHGSDNAAADQGDTDAGS